MEIVKSGTIFWEEWRYLQRMRGSIFTSEFPAYFGFGNKKLKDIIYKVDKEPTEIVKKAMQHGRDMENKFFDNFEEYGLLNALDVTGHLIRNEVSCLFKINTNERDYDIICTPDGYIYNDITGDITILEVKAPYPGFYKGDPDKFIFDKLAKYPLGYETAWIQAMIYAIFDLKAKAICTVMFFEREDRDEIHTYYFEANDKVRKYLTKTLYEFGDLLLNPPDVFRHKGKAMLQTQIKTLMNETLTRYTTSIITLDKKTEEETKDSGP